jgi:hypothetical protein
MTSGKNEVEDKKQESFYRWKGNVEISLTEGESVDQQLARG